MPMHAGVNLPQVQDQGEGEDKQPKINLLTPHELKSSLDEHVIGQDKVRGSDGWSEARAKRVVLSSYITNNLPFVASLLASSQSFSRFASLIAGEGRPLRRRTQPLQEGHGKGEW
jgi:hypothetical protein